jgi:hypothetical protein
MVRHVKGKDGDVIQDLLAELGTMGQTVSGRFVFALVGVWLLCGGLRLCFNWIVCGFVVECVAADPDPLS